MKIGVVPINVGGRETTSRMLEIAAHAEQAGIESLWTFEHVVIPTEYDSVYPYSRDGKMPVAPDTPFFDPLISLAHVAAATKTIRLGTGVNILPQTNPLLFAKQAATLDALSGGRLILGLGLGWLAEEYAAMGTPFRHRGARFDDYITAIKKVWSGDVVEHQSDFLSWSGFRSHPTPVQSPHPPVIIGGVSDKTLRRVATFGQGWYAPSDSESQLRERIGMLKKIADEVGADFDAIEITTNWRIGRKPDALPIYRDLGVHRLVVMLGSVGESDPRRAIDAIAAKAA